MAIYSADYVYADLLMYDLDAAYGILGMGPLSPIWNSYVDPETNQAQYSIALARLPSIHHPSMLTDSSTSSNITLGSTTDSYY